MTTAPYGSWRSPITSDLIVAEAIGLPDVLLDGEDAYWIESRPQEAGRNVVVRGGTDVIPTGFNARTRVHEYGGGAVTVAGGTVYFSNFKDQRLHRQAPGGAPEPITPEAKLRYADGRIDNARGRWIGVREDHSGSGEAVNTIVAIDLAAGGPGQVLAHGYDFFSSPRLSADGRLAWLCWRHPNMPWVGTELWVATLGDHGLRDAVKVAGGDAQGNRVKEVGDKALEW